MEPARVTTAQALAWFTSGWRVFAMAPLQWVVLTILYVLAALCFGFVPLVGPIAWTIITPALYCGLLAIAWDQEAGRGFSMGRVLSGLSDRDARNPLLLLGAILFAAELVVVLVAMASGGAALLALAGMGAGPPAGPQAASGLGLAALLVALGVAVVVAAFVYAAPLVAFAGAGPGEALKSSVRACLVNVVPMTVAGLVLVLATVIAMLPLGLGLLVLTPVVLGALFASYRDLYGEGLTRPLLEHAPV